MYSMTSLQAILIDLRSCGTGTMTSFHSEIGPIEVEVMLM